MTPIEMDEVLWLARCIYSESDHAHEQELVAWVVRNRVETRYRGETYRQVVLEDRQFSAFNAPTARRDYILSLNQNSPAPSWRRAMEIALRVYRANPQARPFEVTTRHFYSPVSMKDRKTPHWAVGAAPLASAAFGVEPDRFLFFDQVDTASAGSDRPSVGTTGRPGPLLKLPPLRTSGSVSRPDRPSVKRAGR
jgi:hypothetical protein